MREGNERMPRVSLIIVNWNGRHLLTQCLPGVFCQSFDDYEVVLFDNGSTDGSIEWVEANFGQVRVLRSQRNLGFARGNNEAIRATTGEYVATLNNDAVPDFEWLTAMVQAAESSPQVGMCAAKMVRAHDQTVMDACGIVVDRAGIAWNRYAGERERPEKDPYPVFGPCAGAALYRRTMLEQVGLFDESYFMYYEDVDLAWRAQRAGWQCLYVPTARVVHRHSGTAGEGSPLKGYLLGRNKVWTLVKNYPCPDLAFNMPLILAYDTAAWLYALLHGDPNPLRGRLAALRELPDFLKKRRAVQSHGRRVPLAPPVNPWKAWRRQASLHAQANIPPGMC